MPVDGNSQTADVPGSSIHTRASEETLSSKISICSRSPRSERRRFTRRSLPLLVIRLFALVAEFALMSLMLPMRT
jgi:hypothetical protein